MNLARLSLMLFCFALTGLGCARAPAPLRVGTTPNYPPLSFVVDGELAGIEIDFARRLGVELGREVEIVQIAWDELLPALDEQRIDVVMSGVSITPERAERVLFSEPYLETSQMILIRKDGPRTRAEFDRPEVRIGFEQLTTGARFVEAHAGRAQRHPFDDAEAAAEALRSGEIDAFVHDAPTIWRVIGRPLFEDEEVAGIYVPLTHEELAWAVRIDDGALKLELDQSLARWREQGWLDVVLLRWMPVQRRTQPVRR